jgi:pyruvate, water dikinase
MGDNFIKWISNLSLKDSRSAGVLGANLGNIYNQKFPTPQAFVLTSDAFVFFLKETGLFEKIRQILREINFDEIKDLVKRSREIKELIGSAKMPYVLEKEILESYDQFNIDLKSLKDSPGALAILKSAREPVFVGIRSSRANDNNLEANSLMEENSIINVKGNDDLINSIKEIIALNFSAESIYYRRKKEEDDFEKMSIIVQKMKNSEKSGFVFSNHPILNNDLILVESVFGFSKGLLLGKIRPDSYVLSSDLDIVSQEISQKKSAIIRNASGQTKIIEVKEEFSKERVLRTHELKSLAEYAIRLKNLFGHPIVFEYAIENNEIFILEVKPINLNFKEGEIQEIDGNILVKGIGASRGVFKGRVRIIHSVEDLDKIKEGDVIVLDSLGQEIIVGLEKFKALIVSEGGVSSKYLSYLREEGIPVVMGAQNIMDFISEGIEVTVDGFSGKIFSGETQNKNLEVLPVVKTKNTKVKVIVDSPIVASRASKSEAEGVGLVSIDSLVSLSGVHPLKYKEERRLNDYYNLIKNNLKEIVDRFIGKEIWVKTSDLRRVDCMRLKGAPEISENNPLMGLCGVRFSLKNEDIFRTEISAIRDLTQNGHKLGIIIPKIICLEEIRAIKEILNQEGCLSKVKLGIMVDTPACALLIKELCCENLDYIVINVSDLVEHTLALDKSNQEVIDCYDEQHPAILRLISNTIRSCRENHVEVSILGFLSIDKRMIKLLVKDGINSICVLPTQTRLVSEMIAEFEEDDKSEEKIISDKRRVEVQGEREERRKNGEEEKSKDKEEAMSEKNEEEERGEEVRREENKEEVRGEESKKEENDGSEEEVISGEGLILEKEEEGEKENKEEREKGGGEDKQKDSEDEKREGNEKKIDETRGDDGKGMEEKSEGEEEDGEDQEDSEDEEENSEKFIDQSKRAENIFD